MKYEHDPIRWTQSPMDAPEALRDPLRAACNEGPSDLQMQALALKLAALSAGGAVAASAATAKASTTAGTTAAGTGAFSVGKIVASLVLVGAAATAVVWQGSRTDTPRAPVMQHREPAPVAQPDELAPVIISAPAAQPELQPAPAAQAASRAVGNMEEPAEPSAPSAEAPQAAPARAPSQEEKPRMSRGRAVTAKQAPMVSAATPSVSTPDAAESANARSAERTSAQPTEIELLRRARGALAARPREAFALTEEHRERYPAGVFAQERDALAVEALVRAGNLKLARSLAEQFVRSHPNSPHAHRFREKMGIQ